MKDFVVVPTKYNKNKWPCQPTRKIAFLNNKKLISVAYKTLRRWEGIVNCLYTSQNTLFTGIHNVG